MNHSEDEDLSVPMVILIGPCSDTFEPSGANTEFTGFSTLSMEDIGSEVIADLKACTHSFTQRTELHAGRTSHTTSLKWS